MENISLKKFKSEFPRQAQKLEAHCNRVGVEFTEDRLNILQRNDGKLRVRVCGSREGWHRLDWDSKKQRWERHSVKAA